MKLQLEIKHLEKSIDTSNYSFLEKVKLFFKKNAVLNVLSSSVNYILEMGGIYLYLGYSVFSNIIPVSLFASTLTAATQFSDNFVSLGNFITNIKDAIDFRTKEYYKNRFENK